MHSGVLLAGSVMLLFPLMVVCICNTMKRRTVNKKQQQKVLIPPTISYSITVDALDQTPIGVMKPLHSPGIPHKTTVSAQSSTDSSKGLLSPNSANLLRVPNMNYCNQHPSSLHNSSFIQMC